MKDFARLITRRELAQCAAMVIFASIASSCTSQSSVSTVSATGASTITANFSLTQVCPNSASCVTPGSLPSTALLTTIMGTANYASLNPNQGGFFPFTSYELKGTCDQTVATLLVTVTPTLAVGGLQSATSNSVACPLGGAADFVLNFPAQDGMYAVTVTPQNLQGGTSGSGASFAVYAKTTLPTSTSPTFKLTNAALTAVIPAGTATFATGGLTTLANPTGSQQVLFSGGATSATLTLTGFYDNAQISYVSTVKDTSSGLGQPGALNEAAHTFTEAVTVTPGTNATFTFKELDLAGNSGSTTLGLNIFTNKYIVPAKGTLAGGGLPLSGAPTGGSGNIMVAFTIMPIAAGNQTSVSSSQVPLSGNKVFVGTGAIAAQGPSSTESSNP